MTYEETEEYILKIPLFAEKLGTDEVAALLRRLGDPQDHAKVVHIAGTNGKGSTAKCLATILMQAGYHVGLFTSPHLVCIRERIQYDDCMISEEDFVWAFETVRAKFASHPSFFEVIFAMAAVYFDKKGADYVIYETGMGGRLDATNVVKPELSVITSVGLDHMEYLGDTIEKIAFEKAGIVKPHIPVVYFKRDAASSGIIEAQAKKLGSPVYAVEKSQYIINETTDKTIDFSLRNRYYKNDHLRIQKTALYQVENALLAVTAFTMLHDMEKMPKQLLDKAITQGLVAFAWTGRMEKLRPGLFVDGAHNPEAIEGYIRTLQAFHRDKKKILVFAAVKDKDYETMIRKLSGQIAFDKILVTGVGGARKAPVSMIAEIFRRFYGQEIRAYDACAEAMEQAILYREQIPDSAIYCVGSLYLVGEVNRWLATRGNADFPDGNK